MQTDLVGSWGIYPWFPELGDDLVAPDSLDVVKSIRPYKKKGTDLFNFLRGIFLRLNKSVPFLL